MESGVERRKAAPLCQCRNPHDASQADARFVAGQLFAQFKLDSAIHWPRLQSENCSIQRYRPGDRALSESARADRTDHKVGENVIFFGPNKTPIPHLVVEK